MTQQVGVAIIGSGYWGVNHVRVFNELPDARVVAICDQNYERLQEVGRRFQQVTLTTELDDVLQMPGVDAVVVCTGATSHYAIARRSLLAGKHVLVEKPLTTGVAEGEELVELAAMRGLILMVGHTFLYNAGVRKIKEYISLGDVGQVYYLYATRTNLGPIRTDVSALWDLAPHDISIFNYLLDSLPVWVSAVGMRVLRNSRDDVGFISLGYPNGVVGHIHVSWANPNKVREVVVVGSNERIVFDDISTTERVRVFEKGVTSVEREASSFGEHQLLMRDGAIIIPKIEASEPLKNECAHFLECVLTGCQPLTSGREGVEVVQVMEAIDRSVAAHGAPVVLEYRHRQLVS
ncbi:MAG: Gfo/Idh/MocA family oxidoreductase [Chloroflexota bacterium]|nr:MAG: oxidoreductase [Chloroflexota bacterium]